jgi:hypothetical protein
VSCNGWVCTALRRYDPDQLKAKRRILRKKLLKIFGQFPTPLPTWAADASKLDDNEQLFCRLEEVTPSPIINA